MQTPLRRYPALAAASILSVLLSATAAGAAGGNHATDAQADRPGSDQGYALVQLQGDPLSIDSRTRPPRGKKIDFDSGTVKAYRAKLSALRNDFKSWLRSNAPNAKVTGEFDLALNAVSLKLNGESLATIAGAPMVLRAEPEGLYYPNAGDPDLAIINAPQAWALGAAASAGEGVKVAIIDTGIDATHPCFSDAGYPPQTQRGDARFTNNKVIAARVFNNKTPSRHYTAEALQEHGTHVAGTVACNSGTPATVSGVTISHPISGVAPRALLGNYNVFPGDVTNARSEDILNALEAAYTDGFDIANLSLGGGASGIQDLLTVAVDNLDEANMVVAVAAGNSGPGHYTVESPGSAARALTAGAATVGHYIGAPVSLTGSTYGGVVGEFAVVGADLTAPLGVVSEGAAVNGIGIACGPLTAGSLAGKIALISRGSCSFSTKIRNGQAAGAVAVLVVNNAAGDGVAMGADGTPSQPTIPAYMLSIADGLAAKTSNGAATTIGSALQYFVSGNDDFMASFSGQGPTDVDFRVKPDVVAPGVNVLSSIPHQFCGAPSCFAFFQGTSMATPHLAGSAAVVRWLHPDWSAAQVRSAVVNTAAQNVLKRSASTALEHDVNIIGAGREDLLAAASATMALDPVSVSFGAVPSGSGISRSATVTLTNLSAGPQTVNVSVDGGDADVAYSVSPAFVTLLGGESAALTVRMSAVQGAGFGGHAATLRLRIAGGEVAHSVLYTYIK